jgi:hypothetical protein
MDSPLQRALTLIDEATEGMTDEQLSWHPEGKWSSANILEHLSRAFAGTVKGFDRTLKAGKVECRTCTLREQLLILAVARVGFFPPGRKSPTAVEPQGMAPQQAMREIRANLAAVDKLSAECEQKFGPVKILVHPVLGPLTPREWRKFHFVHTRHHMKQIRELRSRAGAERAMAAQVKS